MDKYREPLLNVEDVLPILNKISLFGGLNDDQLYTVFHMLEVERFHAGEYIFHQGGEPDHIRIVLSGKVRIVEEVEGSPLELAEFGPGECFGEASVIGIHRHTASALAVEDTELLIVPRDKLFQLYHSDSALFGMLMMNIAREACRRLTQTKEIMLHYAVENDRNGS